MPGPKATAPGRPSRRDDHLMRVGRVVLWTLWLACLLFTVWFFTELITLFLQAESW